MGFKTVFEDCDILVVGGGMGGTGAAYEARHWGRDMKIVVAEKANIDRSGAVAQGLYAINCYMGMQWDENQPEDHVRYARNDLMGMVREDLAYDMARHVDSTVHKFEEWGLPLMRDPETGRYQREGKWQIMIHGESYKPIVAEAAKKSADKIYNRIMVTHLLMDESKENRVGGAIGFNVRTGDLHVFKAKATIVGAGGASHIYKPRSVGEGMGRTWYAPWSSASAYALPIMAGAKMTQMENRIVLCRFKDGYGPVGAYFLHLKTYTQNAYGDEYESKWYDNTKELVGDYIDHHPTPTCLRNHAFLKEVAAGRGPIHMVTKEAFQDPHKETVGWENFLGMTVSQAVVWASQDIDPRYTNPELTTSEPYVMGSHATCSGAWASGPEDVSPSEYFWGYNRMMTVEGLFGAGDALGGTAHAFSSGSFTEGRLAAKAAVKYVRERANEKIVISDKQIEERREEIYRPLETYEVGRNEIVGGTVSPSYILPIQGLQRLEKLMDEYAGGLTVNYMTNEPLLLRGLELLKTMHEDFEFLGAEDLHQLQRAWELKHRAIASECVVQHTLFRKETRWPGYYYRGDAMQLDDENWHVLTVSHRNPESGEYTMEKAPVYHIVD
ncbi:MAG: adenylyl-sulfate reductase subunit alpha [Proteobacteria bacterium]|jgi:adenylylsulfate reductase subunit A|nr:adenylyl-sulfate reductase subunit alpha [Pseudomonadota bacterium]MDB4827326.1 adenylyl-sulfate reductase subunit alpha [Gammaproteobacteria bacterium]MBT4357850.1 adenylyl-sulfate reductase subunit alpha [Pseudomonadota bacterium]MBT4988414.1 adenylyl-sulfate reductase subunit alpha [Pseudomonadota bacterium]MBT6657147.1 adenylyl-sulfate reductase subunit alpha [Pseudomonadota bacterium]